MSIWLIAIGCLVVGIVTGVAFASRLNTSPSHVQELENQIRSLKESHNEYKDNVSDHFSLTAELFQHMTESYREVYQHLANGAQDLCSSEVANKLLPAEVDAGFEETKQKEAAKELIPPKDYAVKRSSGQIGALSEDFGIEKNKIATDK